MGLSHSKAHPRVTKVAPLQNKGEETPSPGPMDFAFSQNLEERSTYSLARLQDRNKALEGQLPPLRETWYGRHPAVPRDMYFDIPLEQGETSIIKRHPPRRLQKLEPIHLSQAVTPERFLSQREARTTRKAKHELEKKMQIPMYTSGKRQYLHKMQMLEMNRKRQEAQAELKKSLHREAKTNKEKLRDQTAKKILDSIPQNSDDDFLTVLPDETLNPSPEVYCTLHALLAILVPSLEQKKAKEPHLVVKENEARGENVNQQIGVSQFGAICRYSHPSPLSPTAHAECLKLNPSLFLLHPLTVSVVRPLCPVSLGPETWGLSSPSVPSPCN